MGLDADDGSRVALREGDEMRTKLQTREALVANRIKFLMEQIEILADEIEEVARKSNGRYPNTASDLFSAIQFLAKATDAMAHRTVTPLG